MWSNLRKGQDMDTGTIGFHNTKDVRKKIGVSRDRIFEHTELMDYNDFMNKSADVSSAKAYEEDFM